MSDISNDILESVKEIIRINRYLRAYRVKVRQLEKEKLVHKDNILSTYKDAVRFVTPYGNVSIHVREPPVTFSLQDIQTVLQGVDGITDGVRMEIQAHFDDEADRLSKSVRILTVQRPQTHKRSKKGHKRQKTLKNHNDPTKDDTRRV